MEIAVLLPVFAQQHLHKNADVPDIYFTLLDAAGMCPILVLNQNAKTREEAGSLSKKERQKLKRLCTQGGAAYGSVLKSVKASNLPVSKVRQVLTFKTFVHKNDSGQT